MQCATFTAGLCRGCASRDSCAVMREWVPGYFEDSLKGAWRVRAQGSIAAGTLIQCWQDICNYTLISPKHLCSMCALM